MKKLKQTILMLAAVLMLCGCAKKDELPMYILTIWDAPEADDGTSLDFSQSSEQVQLERSGFVRAVNNVSGTIGIYEYLVSEQNEPIEYMSDIATIFRSTDTLMTVGANTAVGTQYAEGESEFFNVPILIPFIDGDLFSSETAGNAMNLSPSSEAYANYFSEHLYPDGFNRNLESYLFADSVVPDYSVKAAIFFPDDFNGHNTAVLIGQALMANGADLEVYSAYAENYLDETVANEWKNNQSRMNDMDIVVIIGSHSQTKNDLSYVMESWQGRQTPPAVIVCGVDVFDTIEVVSQYDNLYFVHQVLDVSKCPDDITTYDEAMGYAAGYVTASALIEVRDNPPARDTNFFSFLTGNRDSAESHRQLIEAYRDSVSTALRNLGGTDIPCYGKLRFTQNGQIDFTMGLFRYTDPEHMELVDESEIFNRVVRHIREKYNIND